MKMELRAPCINCPFRTDVEPYLYADRCADILHAITDGQKTFACHKTTGATGARAKELQHCAGAMILLEKIKRPNQYMRIMERIGMYDHTKLRMDAPVYNTPDEMIEAYEKQEERNGTTRPKTRRRSPTRAKRPK